MKKIQLQFKPRSGYAISDLVDPGTKEESFVVGMLTDCQTWDSAKEFLEEVRDIVAGRREPSSGYGNMYFTDMDKDFTTIEQPDGVAVTVPTEVVLDALEQWVRYLEREYPGSGVPIG